MLLVHVAKHKSMLDESTSTRVIKLDLDYSVIKETKFKVTRIDSFKMFFLDVIPILMQDESESQWKSDKVSIAIGLEFCMQIPFSHLIILEHDNFEAYLLDLAFLLLSPYPHVVNPLYCRGIFCIDLHLIAHCKTRVMLPEGL